MTNELLKQAIELGIINEADVQQKMEMHERNKLLQQHPFKIWCGVIRQIKCGLLPQIKNNFLRYAEALQSVLFATISAHCFM